MSRWRTILATVAVACGVLAVAGLGAIYSGVYNIGADAPHWAITSRLFETARVRSVRAHAERIPVPGDLESERRILSGVEHFAAHCAVCHGAPGVPQGDIAHGLYPGPPDLAGSPARFSRAELFWIVRHGIKMTGMPAWTDHSDEEIWALVAFIEKLPGMTPDAYAKLIMASMGHGSRHDHGAQPAGTPPSGQPRDPPGADHKH